eukprot:1148700-Pelagomonas_calceolata.AAC.3
MAGHADTSLHVTIPPVVLKQNTHLCTCSPSLHTNTGSGPADRRRARENAHCCCGEDIHCHHQVLPAAVCCFPLPPVIAVLTLPDAMPARKQFPAKGESPCWNYNSMTPDEQEEEMARVRAFSRALFYNIKGDEDRWAAGSTRGREVVSPGLRPSTGLGLIMRDGRR